MYKKKSSLIFLCACMICLLWGFDRFCHRSVRHFSLSKITSSLPYEPQWELPSSDLEVKEVKKILEQDFIFLNKGTQSFVFLSKDGNYVLKFFRHNKYRSKSFLSHLPFTAFYKKYNKRQQELQDTFLSCKTAFLNFKEETGLIYLHLNKSFTLNQKISFFDNRQKHYIINADDVEFILQKRADLIYPYLSSLMDQQDIEGAKKALNSFFELLEMFGKKGVYGNDPIFKRNFGFIDGKAVQIDIGQLKVDPMRIDKPLYKQETKRHTESFKKWIEKNYPELCAHFEKKLDEIEQH